MYTCKESNKMTKKEKKATTNGSDFEFTLQTKEAEDCCNCRVLNKQEGKKKPGQKRMISVLEMLTSIQKSRNCFSDVICNKCKKWAGWRRMRISMNW